MSKSEVTHYLKFLLWFLIYLYAYPFMILCVLYDPKCKTPSNWDKCSRRPIPGFFLQTKQNKTHVSYCYSGLQNFWSCSLSFGSSNSHVQADSSLAHDWTNLNKTHPTALLNNLTDSRLWGTRWPRRRAMWQRRPWRRRRASSASWDPPAWWRCRSGSGKSPACCRAARCSDHSSPHSAVSYAETWLVERKEEGRSVRLQRGVTLEI